MRRPCAFFEGRLPPSLECRDVASRDTVRTAAGDMCSTAASPPPVLREGRYENLLRVRRNSAVLVPPLSGRSPFSLPLSLPASLFVPCSLLEGGGPGLAGGLVTSSGLRRSSSGPGPGGFRKSTNGEAFILDRAGGSGAAAMAARVAAAAAAPRANDSALGSSPDLEGRRSRVRTFPEDVEGLLSLPSLLARMASPPPGPPRRPCLPASHWAPVWD